MSFSVAVAIEELAQYELAALPKPRQLQAMLALDAALTGPLDALVVGEGKTAQRQLESVGFRVELVASIEGAVSALARQQYCAVLVSAHVDGDADGLRFVRAVKRARSVQSEALAAIRRHHPRTPFVILPLFAESECAVFWTSAAWCIADLEAMGLPRLVCAAIAASDSPLL